MFLLAPKIGYLTDRKDELVWSGKMVVPNRDAISRIVDELPGAGRRVRMDGLETLTSAQTVEWASGIAVSEAKELAANFLGPTKTYESYLLRSLKRAEANLCFRLMTLGVGGYTGYRYSWRRVGIDEFLCMG